VVGAAAECTAALLVILQSFQAWQHLCEAAGKPVWLAGQHACCSHADLKQPVQLSHIT